MIYILLDRRSKVNLPRTGYVDEKFEVANVFVSSDDSEYQGVMLITILIAIIIKTIFVIKLTHLVAEKYSLLFEQKILLALLIIHLVSRMPVVYQFLVLL
jgi:hypothetical protein